MDVENYTCIIKSTKDKAEFLINNNNILDFTIEEECILIQRRAKMFIHKNRLKRLKKYNSVKIIQYSSILFLKNINEKKKKVVYEHLLNYIYMKRCRKLFFLKRLSAIIIQYHFRKFYKNLNYSQKCRLIRENIILKNTVKKLKRHKKKRKKNDRYS